MDMRKRVPFSRGRRLAVYQAIAPRRRRRGRRRRPVWRRARAPRSRGPRPGSSTHLGVGPGCVERPSDLVRAAKRVAFALDHQQRHADGSQVRHAKLVGLAWRVQRVPQRHAAPDRRRCVRLAEQHRRHASAHRLAADGQRAVGPGPGHVRDDVSPGVEEDGRTVRHLPPGRDVRKVERDDPDAAVGEVAGAGPHPRMTLPGAGAVGEYQRVSRLRGCIQRRADVAGRGVDGEGIHG